MKKQIVHILLLALCLGGQLHAQVAQVRTANEVRMPPGSIDCNSPAFWWNNRLYWFGSHGSPRLSEGPSQFGPWTPITVSMPLQKAWPGWMEAVWCDDDGTLFGWYHTEPDRIYENSTLTAPRIGAVVSFDGGQNFFDLGIVLESGDPLDENAQNGYFAGGNGDFSVILDRERKYFYFFFGNYGGPAENQGVAVARMAFEDRFVPVDRVQKYYAGEWNEPGLGGRLTPIFTVRRPWQSKAPDALWGPSVHWNTYLNSYVMLLNHARGQPGWSQAGIFISFATDLTQPETWKEPTQILDNSDFPGWYYFYPQVMGLGEGETDTLAGQNARLYVGGISRWEIEFSLNTVEPVEPVNDGETPPEETPPEEG